MKIAVMGKGGSGKTTTAAVLARSLAQQGHRVFALDCDTNPNLGLSLGLGLEDTAALVSLRDALEEAGEAAEHATDVTSLLARFGTSTADGVHLAVVNQIADPEPDCP